MTAPNVIWVYDDGLWIEAWDAPPSGARYIRADAPELVALRDAAKLMVAGYEGDDDRTIAGYHALKSAIAAYEALQ